MPQGQPIGGEAAREFLLAWRAKAKVQVYLAPSRDPSIVAALKQEYLDFYKSIGFSRSADEAKNAFGAANPDKKRKQAVSLLLFILLWFYSILYLCSGMQRKPCAEFDPRRAQCKIYVQARLEEGNTLHCLRPRTCLS